jgi:hypothetical protein
MRPSKYGYYGFRFKINDEFEPVRVALINYVNSKLGCFSSHWSYFRIGTEGGELVEDTEDWQWSNLKFEPMAQQTRDCSNCRALIPGDGNPHVCWEKGNMETLPDPNTCDKWSRIRGILIPHL